MRKVLSICVALACLASGVPAAAQDAVVKRIIEIGKTDNRVMHQIDVLTNRFGGRVLGSDAFENAAEWMVREYKSWGLDVDLEEAGTLPVGFNRGPWFGRMLGENSMHLHFVTPSYTSGTKGAQAWVKSHPEGLGRISNMFNRDGGSESPVGIYVPQAMYDDFVKICAPIKQIRPDYPFEIKLREPRKRPTEYGGTDASVFAVEGVPTIGFMTDDIKGYDLSYDEIWHTERDLYNKNIPEYQEHTATVTAIVALGVVNLDKQLSREGLYIKE